MGIFGGPSAEKILAKGDEVPGTITGIAVSYTSDGDTERRVDDYAVTLVDGRTIGIRQWLMPEVEVRLGMHVSVTVLGDDGVIGWGRVETYRHKALKDPPEAGIVDRKRDIEQAKKKGVPARITVTSVERRPFMGGLVHRREGTVTVEPEGVEPYEAELKPLDPAFYATHLLQLDRTFPGWVRLNKLDKPIIDWAAAATADPGVGVPPSQLGAPPPQEEAETVVDARPVEEQLAEVANSGLSFGGVDLATYAATEIAMQKGTPAPEGWPAVAQAWQQAIMSDWRVGAAFGEAIESARKDAKKRR